MAQLRDSPLLRSQCLSRMAPAQSTLNSFPLELAGKLTYVGCIRLPSRRTATYLNLICELLRCALAKWDQRFSPSASARPIFASIATSDIQWSGSYHSGQACFVSAAWPLHMNRERRVQTGIVKWCDVRWRLPTTVSRGALGIESDTGVLQRHTANIRVDSQSNVRPSTGAELLGVDRISRLAVVKTFTLDSSQWIDDGHSPRARHLNIAVADPSTAHLAI
ncbi:uncharacterized protein C8Q71DRAFT_851346 [Rhodofomes roseus]|uniref:Uncharacterized protein n=1 Tax=Rhodofomes roseus TaxID=34475 RepID=A0ABQ8K0Y9_9APHY|nr:uncharacterized protein C8Q71DRAFT_851346 [Rhodofomes roseus]KAH9830359.1 hypothetical protein C8Q71DRAFT_851346 [Rhodofomes roseus]